MKIFFIIYQGSFLSGFSLVQLLNGTQFFKKTAAVSAPVMVPFKSMYASLQSERISSIRIIIHLSPFFCSEFEFFVICVVHIFMMIIIEVHQQFAVAFLEIYIFLLVFLLLISMFHLFLQAPSICLDHHKYSLKQLS